MKSKLVLLGLLAASFEVAALKPVVEVSLFGGASHSGIKFNNKFAEIKVKEEDKKEDKAKEDKAKEDKAKNDKKSDVSSHKKAGFVLGAGVDVSFKKENLSFGVEAGLMLNIAKYGQKDFDKINSRKAEIKKALGEVFEKNVDEIIQALENDNQDEKNSALNHIKEVATEAFSSVENADARVNNLHSQSEKYSQDAKGLKNQKSKASLVTNNGMLFFVGPNVGMQFNEKMSAKAGFNLIFSGVTIEPKDVEVEKYSKTFFGFGPKVSFKYDITSSISAFAFAGYFFFVDKKYEEKKNDKKEKDVKSSKETLAVKGEFGIQHSNMFLAGAGVSFKLNG